MGFFELDGPRLPPQAGGKAKSLVVLLHGLGADGNDLISLAPLWARVLPNTAFVSPHAPFPCDMAPYGRQWFSLLDRTPARVLAGVQAAAPILDAFLDAELARHELPPERLALVGFSQGTMMSLFVAPRRPVAIAGVVGYSGALVGAELLPGELRARGRRHRGRDADLPRPAAFDRRGRPAGGCGIPDRTAGRHAYRVT